MKKIELVIFDCDGVLIDSEMVSGIVFISELKRYDIHLPERVFFERMIGRSFDQAIATIREEVGKAPPPEFKEELRTALLARFERELQPIKGITMLLAKLKTKICVATSSDPVRAARSLAITGLADYFGPNVFSATMVQKGKPAPDLFLHAAHSLETAPKHCIVIEDSAFGLMAAKSAGMTAWHFSGGSHFDAGYSVPETVERDASYSDMAEVLGAARALHLL
jgi:HAD superfamily hydrolase (TIGR01509 family)